MISRQKTALIVGASGLIGGHLLSLLLNHDDYHTIFVAGRKGPSGLNHPKLKYIKADLSEFAKLPIEQIDDIFCAIGTTIKKAETQTAFRLVDYNAVIDLAQWAKNKQAKHFAVVSSLGANSKSNNFYLKTKGQMEEALMQIELKTLIVVRPSLLLGKRQEFRFGEKVAEISTWFFNPILKLVLPKYAPIKALKVAKAMVSLCETTHNTMLFVESNQLQKF